MLYARSATRWPARMLALASISVAAFLLAAGSASAVPFTNATAVPIADAGGTAAAPTNTQGESDITASGVVGNISKVTATLNGYNHACPIDSDVLLVGPGGQTSILMSDIGDCKSATRPGVNLVFDDAAATPVPCILSSNTVTNTLAAGTYQPTDASPATNGGAIGCDPPNDPDHSPGQTPGPLADVFTGVTKPLAGWGHSLSTFNNSSPNGVWRLIVVDQYHLDAGSINGGWKLDFTIAPPTVGAPTISGTPQVGQLLTAVSGPTTGAGAPTYQWNHCSVTCTAIPGANGATYVPQSSDANTAITVTEAVTNSSGAVATATSNPTATVAGGTVLPPNVAAVISSSKTKTTQKVLRQGGVLAAFTSSANGNLVASGTISVPNLAKTYRFTVVKSKVVAGNPTTIRLKLSSKALKAVKNALGKHKKLKAKITLLVTTPSGAKTTVHKTIKLAR